MKTPAPKSWIVATATVTWDENQPNPGRVEPGFIGQVFGLNPTDPSLVVVRFPGRAAMTDMAIGVDCEWTALG